MRCPFCGYVENKVVDSRVSKDASVIRRRRQCLECDKRFTTYERLEELVTYVIKKDGSREVYDRNKLMKGLMIALNKRPGIRADQVEEFLDKLENSFQERNVREVPTTELGEAVMNKLQEWDDVAYIRFASVYKDFNSLAEFKRELERILEYRKNNNA